MNMGGAKMLAKRQSPGLSKKILEELVSGARDAALIGSQKSLKYFDRLPTVEKKADRSPVTKADRETESAIRKVLKQKFPSHQIIGEEHGPEGPEGSEFRWWIDPIDGTLQFIRGIPFWGSVLGVEYQGEVVAGAILLPAAGIEMWAAKGLGCFMNGKACRVSKVSNLKNATISTGNVFRGSPKERSRTLKIASKAYDVRGSFDIFSHVLVISGKMDAAFDFAIKPYDVSAVKICVEEAGGRYCGLGGEDSIYSSAGFSSNGKITSECLH